MFQAESADTNPVKKFTYTGTYNDMYLFLTSIFLPVFLRYSYG